MEIARGIHAIPMGIGHPLGPFAPQVYLVVGGDGALIDSGYGDEGSISSLEDFLNNFTGLRLTNIVVTHSHPDHAGGAASLREKMGARIVLHSAEKTSFKADRLVAEGDNISLSGIDLEVIHTPGHNPGHICLYMRKERVMFSGDHVLGLGTTAIHPPGGDMAQYIASLRKLLAYDIKLICPGHGPPIREPGRKLEELIEHRQEREGQVIACLFHGEKTVKQLVLEIYPELAGFLYELARGQIYAHLIKLEGEERVSSQGTGENTTYTLASARGIYA